MTNKIDNLKDFNAWVEQLMHGVSAKEIKWDFMDGKYTTLFNGVPNDENFWMWREFLRLYKNSDTGKPFAHTAPLWQTEGQLQPIEGHFAHVATSDNLMIAYTPNADKGRKDVHVKVKPGRYLQQFYPDLTAAQVRDWADRHRYEYSMDDLKFAATPEEVEYVYRNGPDSCMSRARRDFKMYGSDLHPTHVYGASPTTVVAYIDRGGKISGRALCDIGTNPSKYGRIYGDERVLKAKLERSGFVAAGQDGFHGMKLAIVRDRFGRIVMPYVDWNPNGYKEDDFIIIGAKRNKTGYSLQSTSGYLAEQIACPSCGSRSAATEYIVDGDRIVCPCCGAKHTSLLPEEQIEAA